MNTVISIFVQEGIELAEYIALSMFLMFVSRTLD